MTGFQQRVINAMVGTNPGAMHSVIAYFVGTSTSAVTRAMKQLRRAGLVENCGNKNCRRAKLTAAGYREARL